MIVWRGIGFLGLSVVLGIPLGYAVWSITGLPEAFTAAFVGLGLLVGAVPTYLAGVHVNVRLPGRRLGAWETSRRAELHEQVASGTFLPPAGSPHPQTRQQASAQIEAVLGLERQRALYRKRRNVHTLFFLPMQSIGILGGVVGMVLVVVGLVSGLG